MHPAQPALLVKTSARRKEMWLQPAFVYVVLTVSLGLATLVANPPFQAPDENDHYYRALQVSQGELLSKKWDHTAGGSLPAAAPATVTRGMADIHFRPHNKMTRARFEDANKPRFFDWAAAPRVDMSFPHTVVYPPSAYLPQAVAMAVGKLGHLGPLALMYLARLAGFVVCVWAGYLALRSLPIYRWSCLVLLLCPMSVYLLGSIAPDGLLISSAVLLAARLLRLQLTPDAAFDRREQLLLLGLGFFLSVTKSVYLPLALVAPLGVWFRSGARRERMVFAGTMVVGCVVLVWVWSGLLSRVWVPGRTDIVISPEAQAQFVLKHPLTFLSVVGQSFAVHGPGLYRSMVGVLGWLDTELPQWYREVFTWGIQACILAESVGVRTIRWWLSLAMLGAVAAAIGLILCAQYATWNPPGSVAPIDGLQGRYFLPLAPWVILCWPALPGRLKGGELIPAILGTGLAVLGAGVCFAVVVLRYYCR